MPDQFIGGTWKRRQSLQDLPLFLLLTAKHSSEFLGACLFCVYSRAPSHFFFFTFHRYTKCSFMLQVVHRSSVWDLTLTVPHSFVFHGELVLLAQSFPVYFACLPVGVRRRTKRYKLQKFSQKSLGVAYLCLTKKLAERTHSLCLFIIAGLACRDRLYAHTREATGIAGGPTAHMVDCPCCIGGGGSKALPYATLSSNPNCNTPYSAD